MEPAVVEIRGISKHFGEGPTRVDALRDVSLDVFPGTVIGLRGPSGSGKSTLLNVIGCILEPNSGSMRLNGDLVYDGKWLRADLRALRLEKIGFIFQSHNLLPFLNAWENVAIARILAGATLAQARDRALELLAYLGVERRRDAMPGELSGGEAQRVAIARALANDPAHHPRRRADRRARFAARRHRDGHAAQGGDRTPYRRDRGHARREDLQPLRSHPHAARRGDRSPGTRGRVNRLLIGVKAAGPNAARVLSMPHNSKGETMHDWPEMTKELSAQLRNLRGGAPDVMKAFAGIAQAATAAKALDTKTKELIALGIAVAARCDDCIAFHVKAAVERGASREEVLETLGMAIYMGTGPAVMYASHALEAFSQFEAARAPATAPA